LQTATFKDSQIKGFYSIQGKQQNNNWSMKDLMEGLLIIKKAQTKPDRRSTVAKTNEQDWL